MPLPRLQLPHGVQIDPRRRDRGADRGDAQRGHGPRRLGAAVPRPRRAGRGRRERRRRAAPAARADQRHAPLQAGQRRPRSLRLRPHRRGPLGPPRHRRARRPPRRLRAETRPRRSQLAEFASTLEARPDPDGALAWAVARFELGCGRESPSRASATTCWRCARCSTATGPVGASLPMRASALIADESFDRIEARERIESALELERSLMNGSPSTARPGAGRLDRGRRAPHPARRRPRRARHRPQHGRRRDPDRDRPRGRRRDDRRHDFRVGDTRDGRGGGDSDVTIDAAHHEPEPSRASTTTRRPASSSRFPARTRSASPPRPGSTRSRSPTAPSTSRRSRATSSTASGSTPPASATSSQSPRTRTGRSRELNYDHYGHAS